MDYHDFFHSMKTQKIAFIGMGVTNGPLIRLFLSKGIELTICDKRSQEEIGDAYQTLKRAGVSFILGEEYLDTLANFDVVFRSPGVYYNRKELVRAQENGTAVTSEMEMFFELCPCKIVAVTGSDGKTTTTTLIAHMLREQGHTVHLGGNIGKALLSQIEKIRPSDVAVVELSSFQLLSMRQSPDVAVITNVAPNHLDVHGTMEEYIEAKCHILWHQNAFSKAVLNLDNKTTMSLSKYVRGKLETFGRKNSANCGVYLNHNDEVCVVENGMTVPILKKEEIQLPGVHNLENVMAAIAAVHGMVSPQNMKKVAMEFGGVEHRMEFVRQIHGVDWYNDSIATSPTRTIAGLRAFRQKIIVIAGGYDKKIPYQPLAPELVSHAKALILLGATANKIACAVCENCHYDAKALPIYRVESLEDAVQKAKEIAGEGDIVSLSPASASFDLYKNFEERGNHYKKIVNQLK